MKTATKQIRKHKALRRKSYKGALIWDDCMILKDYKHSCIVQFKSGMTATRLKKEVRETEL